MIIISFMVQVTVVSNWLTSGHQSCCWDSFARLLNFLLEVVKCCWICTVHWVLQVTPQEKGRWA